jgi:hypothetical protein
VIPQRARATIARLEQDEIDSRALSETAKAARETAVSALWKARQAGDATVIKNAEADLQAAEELLHKRQSRRQNSAAVLRNVQQFLAKLPANVVLEDVAGPKPKLKAGETWAGAIDRVCATINSLNEALRLARQAPRTRAELKAKAAAYVAEMAERAKPRVSVNQFGELAINWTPDQRWESAGSASLAHVYFQSWMDGPALVAKLHAQIDELGIDDSKAIPAAERADRIAKLESELLAAEMLEEQYVAAAQAAGFDKLRRPRADARAVLGVRISTKAARAA